MKIQIAKPQELVAVMGYDRHIPKNRLQKCLCDGYVYALYDACDRIIGVLRYSLFWQHIPFVDLLYIDEGYQRMGHGRSMMARWEADMAAQGFSYVMLSTQEDEDAKFFYEKLGYRKIGAFLPPEQQADELMYGKELR